LTESAAIQMNDYLLLGATLGVPALFCFGMHSWLTIVGNGEGSGLGARGARTEGQKAEGGNPPSLRYGATRAGDGHSSEPPHVGCYGVEL